jgi:hypothetical protein
VEALRKAVHGRHRMTMPHTRLERQLVVVIVILRRVLRQRWCLGRGEGPAHERRAGHGHAPEVRVRRLAVESGRRAGHRAAPGTVGAGLSDLLGLQLLGLHLLGLDNLSEVGLHGGVLLRLHRSRRRSHAAALHLNQMILADD